jgi:hypothetical protein
MRCYREIALDRCPAQSVRRCYIEAAVDGVLITSIYLPNGNPQPGPKFDYKLAWFERRINHGAELTKAGVPVVFAGDLACLTILRIPRQAGSRQHRIAVPCQDRYAVPGTLTEPDSAIPEVTKGTCRKCSLLRLQLLEATTSGCALASHDMRLCGRLLMLLILKVAIFNGRASREKTILS